MKLIDLLDHINQFDDDHVIFVPTNSRLNEDTEATVSKIHIVDNEQPSLQTQEGMKYLLEVELAKDVIQVWRDWRNGKEPSPIEKYQAILYYVENDAYLAADD